MVLRSGATILFIFFYTKRQSCYSLKLRPFGALLIPVCATLGTYKEMACTPMVKFQQSVVPDCSLVQAPKTPFEVT